MRWLIVAACLTLGTLPALAGPDAWPRFRGHGFTIDYPPGFRARPAAGAEPAPGTHGVPGFVSAFFTSPDRSVKFYVFSAVGADDPEEIEIDIRKEAYVSRKEEQLPAAKGVTKDVRRVTIRAKDGSYTRSFEDTRLGRNADGEEWSVRHVFGIQYRSAGAYQRYLREYQRFRASYRPASELTTKTPKTQRGTK